MILMLDVGPKQLETAKKDFNGKIKIGQLLTPLTRYADHGLTYGIDNGAFSRFDSKAFMSLLERQKNNKNRCMFVAVPDVVGSARRTLEIFDKWKSQLLDWPIALVAQDGLENFRIPWDEISAIFIGGSTEWKLSKNAEAVIKCALALNKWVHVGRVNTPHRFDKFNDLGCHSVDGSGISRFSHMRLNLLNEDLFHAHNKTI